LAIRRPSALIQQLAKESPMRFPICATAICVALLFPFTTSVKAHGPGGAGHNGPGPTGRPNLAGGPSAGEFQPGGFHGKSGGGDGQKWLDGGGPNPFAGKADKPGLSNLHPAADSNVTR